MVLDLGVIVFNIVCDRTMFNLDFIRAETVIPLSRLYLGNSVLTNFHWEDKIYCVEIYA